MPPHKSPSEKIDPTVLMQAALGDTPAWKLLFRRVHRRVRAVLGRECPDVDDTVNDALLKVAQALREPGCVRRVGPYADAWVRRIALNTAIDAHRALRRSARYSVEVEAADSDAADVAAPLADVGDVGDRISLTDALLSLDAESRLIVILHHVDRYTNREIAEICGIPENTVKSRAMRALEKLHAYLRDGGDLDGRLARSGV
jgi:RNA polymerase sigma-70 factor (ECF subfamily)